MQPAKPSESARARADLGGVVTQHSHGREMGWTDPGGGADGNRRVRQASRNPHPGQPPHRELVPSQDKPDQAHNPERNNLWRKALALGVPQAVLHGQPTDHIRKLLGRKTKDQAEILANTPPHNSTNTINPFRSLRGELNELKN